jgi:hypothetical protein
LASVGVTPERSDAALYSHPPNNSIQQIPSNKLKGEMTPGIADHEEIAT